MSLRGTNYEERYKTLLKNLETAILAEYGSLRSFCIKHKIGYTNLNKVFSDNMPEELGVGLYIRICVALQIPEFSDADLGPDIYAFRMSLKDYLRVPNNRVILSMLTVNGL